MRPAVRGLQGRGRGAGLRRDAAPARTRAPSAAEPRASPQATPAAAPEPEPEPQAEPVGASVSAVAQAPTIGWSVMEGGHPFYLNRKPGPTPFVKPFVEHHHTEARSLTGGVVYHGDRFPEMRGAYIYGDWSTGKIWGVKHQGRKKTWHRELATTTLQITGFGIDARGELLIADHGGGFYQLEPTPPELQKTSFPKTLSETGLFASVKEHRVQPALIPYDVVAPLWADDTYKERFIAIPDYGQIEFSTQGGWTFPEGTVLVKTFLLDLEEKNPASRRRLETRLLTKQWGQWAGYTYRWNDAQTEAYLVEAGGRDETFTVRNAAGGTRKQTWHYPGRTGAWSPQPGRAVRARREHGADEQAARLRQGDGPAVANAGAPGPVPRQRGGARAGRKEPRNPALSDYHRLLEAPLLTRTDLLRTELPPAWTVLGVRDPWRPALTCQSRRSRSPPSGWSGSCVSGRASPRICRSSRTSIRSWSIRMTRAKSWRSGRGRTCTPTVPTAIELAGGGNAMIDLEFFTPPEHRKLINAPPQHDRFGVPDAKIIVPGHPEKSVLYLPMARRGPGQMPPLATHHVDRPAWRCCMSGS